MAVRRAILGVLGVLGASACILFICEEQQE
jgi:hypothetical protein